MGTDILRCRACARSLTRPVQRLTVLPEREFADEDEVSKRPTMAVGFWAVDPDPLGRDMAGNPVDTPGCLVVNPADGVDLETHPDGLRSSGCCGHDGCGGPNKRCPGCHAEVATLRDDCWTVVELRFEPVAVYVGEETERPHDCGPRQA